MNKLKLLSISIILGSFVIVPKVHAAIAFDSSSSGNTSGSTITISHAFVGTSNPDLTCGVQNSNDVDDVQYATFNGVYMATSTTHLTGGSHQYVYNITGISGTHDVVVVRSTAGGLDVVCLGYTGVNQSNTPDNAGHAQNSGTQTDLTVTGTSIADNAWMVMFYGWQRTPSAGAGTTQRKQSSNNETGGDSNGAINPAGTNNMNFTFASIGDGGMSGAWITLAPAVVPTTVTTAKIQAFGKSLLLGRAFIP